VQLRSYTRSRWAELRDVDRAEATVEIAEFLGASFEQAPLPAYAVGGHPVPAFVHGALGITFNLILGGPFLFGLSPAEYDALEAMREWDGFFDELPGVEPMQPAIEMEIPSFLIADQPVSRRLAGVLLPDADLSERRSNDALPDEGGPVYLARGETVQVTEALGARLPLELQWEYACRGGTTTLFPFGDEPPRVARELDGWMGGNLHGAELIANGFGLYNLFFGEWCRERWRSSHGPRAKLHESCYAIRGGGASMWPWQGHGEWFSCLSAVRLRCFSSGSNRGPEAPHTAALRPVIELP
jgi:hypothetical protein